MKGNLLGYKVVFLAVLVLGLEVLSSSVGAGAGTLSVCPTGCQFSKIQDAINTAQPGDTIEIKAGTYEENLTINSSLTLVGEDRDKVTLKGAQEGKGGITISGGDGVEVTLSGITIAETKLASPKNFLEDGLRVLRSAKLTLSKARLSKNGDSGLELRDRAQAIITDSEFIGNGNNGIGLFDSAQVTISRSKIAQNGSGLAQNFNNGLSAVGRNKLTLQESEISGNTNEGIFLAEETTAQIVKNQVLSNKMNGVVLLDSATVELKENRIQDNTFWGVTEVLIQCSFGDDSFSGQVTGEKNEILGNGKGLTEQQKQSGDGAGNVCPKELEKLKKS